MILSSFIDVRLKIMLIEIFVCIGFVVIMIAWGIIHQLIFHQPYRTNADRYLDEGQITSLE